MEVQNIPYPSFELNAPEQKRKCDHGVIIKCIATNICGSDQHMVFLILSIDNQVRGRTTAPNGLVLGHEITGEVVESNNFYFVFIISVGRDVEYIKPGDIVTVPFNVGFTFEFFFSER